MVDGSSFARLDLRPFTQAVFALRPRYRRADDSGVWNGQSYQNVPVTTNPMKMRKLRAVKEMMTRATELLTVHMCRDRPQARRKRAIWSMIGRLSMNNRNCHFLRPSNLRWRSPQRSRMDPPEWRRYLFTHCLPNIATNAANRDMSRLAYKRSKVVTISRGGPFQGGGAMGSSCGEMEGLRLRRIARRYASDRSLEPGSTFDWMSMTKTALTAENKPA